MLGTLNRESMKRRTHAAGYVQLLWFHFSGCGSTAERIIPNGFLCHLLGAKFSINSLLVAVISLFCTMNSEVTECPAVWPPCLTSQCWLEL